ncbi:MAG: ribonuclease R [Spirochaetota bacterium]
MKRSESKVSGKLSVTNRGFGFVIVADGTDLFIPSGNMYTAMDGDKVQAEITEQAKQKNPVGKVVKIVERSTKEYVGAYKEKDGTAMVVPENERQDRPFIIPKNKIIPSGSKKKPRPGEMVLVRLERWDDPKKDPLGSIIEIIGHPKDPGIDVKIVAKSNGLSTEFPKKVKQQSDRISAADMKAEAKRREDLSGLKCFTIDPESAKDFDDAVSLQQLKDGTFELGVHIADVSHYVQQGSVLDNEAFERGTSVYFVNSVIPMLPEKISNNLCSLRPNEDRLAFSVMMNIDARGYVKDFRIVESVIRSKRRYTYEEVEEIISGKPDPNAKILNMMMMLSLVLRHRREEMGSIDFDMTQPVISLDKNGIPYEVRPHERLDAHRLVEEFMLAANLTVARFVAEKNSAKQPWPFIYRVHERPKEEDLREFLALLKNLGISYRISGELQPEDYRKILDVIENMEFKEFVEKVALRSMTKAVYSTQNQGHFGLAFDAYTHFTSPIRRYPDLEVHRLLKEYSSSGRPRKTKALTQRLESVCAQSSQRERVAIDAEREYTRIKSMQFLSKKIGNTYDGVISGVTSFGIFVELTHYLIDGLVHVSEMSGDFYTFDAENYQFVGKKSGKTYRIGDPIKVKIKNVSIEEQRADFTVVK